MGEVEVVAELSPEVVAKVAVEVAKYPERRAAVKSALRYAQAEHGWVSGGVVQAVAQLLELEPIEVYELSLIHI